MGLFNRKKETNSGGAGKLQHCLIFDKFFILNGNECNKCKLYNECRSFDEHRDFNDGELFFVMEKGLRPVPFAWVKRVSGQDGFSLTMYDESEPRPKEAPIVLSNSEFKFFIKFWQAVRSDLPADIPDTIIVNDGVVLPVKGIEQRITKSIKRGPNSQNQFTLYLDAGEARSLLMLVKSVIENLPLFGYLPNDSWIRKTHEVYTILSGKIIGSI